ncbi:sugar phosphate isomerase/epimerase family protein [Chondrinema litorale]|uniref:sugar phosphate isomerase/epimerase family protein n=1 Tax=Chondrinema litorale TaxID=2994555 RepID=UPI0025437AAB|nr:TIM barrel protein [Chondrinema litorale]UZR94709.1 TIM barrel protein [Chondrinema litorale]
MNKPRRTFLKKTSLAAGALLSPLPLFPATDEESKVSIHVFSRHLQFIKSFDELSEFIASCGFDGADLTIKPNGHILPEEVEEKLPEAVTAFQKSNLSIKTITTNITTAEDINTFKILKAANKVGIKYYRMGYFDYLDNVGMPERLLNLKPNIWQLSKMNSDFKIHGAYHNHVGTRVGSSVWDIWDLIKSTYPEWIGCQFDIRNAVIEGGTSWPNDLKLLHEYVKTVVVRDFKWEKKDGKWQAINTPLGEGMVDFPAFFKQLKSFGFAGPISLHFEYPQPVENKILSITEIKNKTKELLQRDLQKLKTYLQEAELL